MSEMVVHGIPGSPDVRSVLMALQEKGASQRLAAMGSTAFAPLSGEHLLTLAHLMLPPHLLHFIDTPEGRTQLAGTALSRRLLRMQARRAVQAAEVRQLLQAQAA